MKSVKSFEDFVKLGVIKKVSANQERTKSLIKIADRKMNSLKVHLKKIGIDEENANDYVEYTYDLLMSLIRAKMFLEGLKSSGYQAHEAEVSYSKILGLNENEVQFLDQMRFFRNGILYYGTILDKEYAEKVISFTKNIYPKLKSFLKI